MRRSSPPCGRLERLSPNAANSLREGLEKTLTVVKLDLRELLRQTLAEGQLQAMRLAKHFLGPAAGPMPDRAGKSRRGFAGRLADLE